MYGECWAYVILTTIILSMETWKMWKKTDIFICCDIVLGYLCVNGQPALGDRLLRKATCREKELCSSM